MTTAAIELLKATVRGQQLEILELKDKIKILKLRNLKRVEDLQTMHSTLEREKHSVVALGDVMAELGSTLQTISGVTEITGEGDHVYAAVMDGKRTYFQDDMNDACFILSNTLTPAVEELKKAVNEARVHDESWFEDYGAGIYVLYPQSGEEFKLCTLYKFEELDDIDEVVQKYVVSGNPYKGDMYVWLDEDEDEQFSAVPPMYVDDWDAGLVLVNIQQN